MYIYCTNQEYNNDIVLDLSYCNALIVVIGLPSFSLPMFVIVVINGGWVVVVVVVVGFRHLVAFFVDYKLSYIYNKTLVNGKNYKEKKQTLI